MRRHGFDHVRVQRALHEEARVVPHLLGSILEDINERVTDAPALLLRITDSGERREEAVTRIDRDEVDAEVRAEGSLDLIALVKAEQAGVDEDAGELIGNGTVHERRGDRRVDTAGESADHSRRSDLASNLGDLFLDERARRPRGLGTAYLEEEVRDHFPTTRRVRHLGVELHTEHGPGPVTHACDLYCRAPCGHFIP